MTFAFYSPIILPVTEHAKASATIFPTDAEIGEKRPPDDAASRRSVIQIARAMPTLRRAGRTPWRLPEQGLAVFESAGDAARLSHYFLPSLIRAGKRILMLDGANSADPRLMARLGERRGIPFREFSARVRICRAFTCFQLTELIARVPKFLETFQAEAVIVTAFPELYLDEDVRDEDARSAFAEGLCHLRALGESDRPRLAVGVFSSSGRVAPASARRRFFAQTRAAARELWEFKTGEKAEFARLGSSSVENPAEPRALNP